MKHNKILAFLLAIVLTFSLAATCSAAEAGKVYTDEAGNLSYEPLEQGVYSNGGYTIDKFSHTTLGAGEIDGILTGDEQDRGNSYSWSMAEFGDYIYIGTCYNSTYYIFHNNVTTALKRMQASGMLDTAVDASRVAADIVETMFGVDTFDKSGMNDWTPVIMAVHKRTGEAKVIFRERDVWAEYPEIFPGYSPYLATKNYLSGYRMAFEFQGKLYFAGMGNPTATLVEIDPQTNDTKIVYYNTNYTQGVSNGVHGLLVYDNEILMCLATDNYDGKGTPGGIIVASSDPSAGLSQWRVIADQDDFDGLPAVMQVDGLNGGGIWDIIEYNGHLYVTVVTDKNIDGKINKQGFAMYRGDKQEDGSFTWTQIIGDHGTSGYGFGLGVDYSMSCNMWVYDGYLYLGTYNDPMLDLAEIPSTGNFELLYNDLDHSIYLYRMDEKEVFQQIGGKDDNPYFPEGPLGNLGAGLGNNSNQYVWRFGVHNDELYIGTYDTSTLTYQFTQITDGQVANMEYEDISSRSDVLEDALLEVLQAHDNKYLIWFLDKTLFSDYTAKLYQSLAAFATGMSADKNPVPDYRRMQEEYEAYKAKVYGLLDKYLSSDSFFAEYQAQTQMTMYATAEAAPAGFVDDLKNGIRSSVDEIFGVLDQAVYDELIHNFVYYFGCNFYAQQCENGFDLLVSNDGVNFDAITRDGFGDFSNHGLRTICSTEYGVYMGTANPYYGTQLWRMYSDKDRSIEEDSTSGRPGLPGAAGDATFPWAGCDGEEDCPSHSFEDVDSSKWYHTGVDYCVAEGLMKGYTSTCFAPNETTTRAMFATVLYRMAGEPAVTGSSPFADVAESTWYTNAIIWANQQGVVMGYDENCFGPHDFITREQMVTMMYRFAKSQGLDVTAEGDLSAFPDLGQAGKYAAEALKWAQGIGLLQGVKLDQLVILNPKGNATRAQVATILMRFDLIFGD